MITKQVKHIYGDGTEVPKIRIFADDGKVVTNDNGETYWNCIDVDSIDGWVEIDEPVIEDIPESEELDVEVVEE